MALSATSVAEGLRAKKKVQTRMKLQDTALRLFQQRGFAAVSVDEIATEADVSRSTFFRYFGSKEAVLMVGRDERGDAFLNSLKNRPVEESPLQAFEHALTELTLNAAAEDVLDQLRLVSDLLRSDPALRGHRLDELERWSAAMAQAFAERGGRAEPSLEDRLASSICLTVAEEIGHVLRESEAGEPDAVMKQIFAALQNL